MWHCHNTDGAGHTAAAQIYTVPHVLQELADIVSSPYDACLYTSWYIHYVTHNTLATSPKYHTQRSLLCVIRRRFNPSLASFAPFHPAVTFPPPPARFSLIPHAQAHGSTPDRAPITSDQAHMAPLSHRLAYHHHLVRLSIRDPIGRQYEAIILASHLRQNAR